MAFVLASDPPNTLPTKSAGFLTTTSPLERSPISAKIRPKSLATLVFPAFHKSVIFQIPLPPVRGLYYLFLVNQ